MKLMIIDQSKNSVVVDEQLIAEEIANFLFDNKCEIKRNGTKTNLAREVDRFLKKECEK